MTPSAAPPLTVGIPVYNGERYLARTLESLRAQEFTDFRVVIADNASTDATADIAHDVTRTDERFTYCRHETNIGGAANCNYLLHKADSRWFKWAYYDDVCDRKLLRRSFEVLAESPPDTVLAYPRVVLIDEDGKCVGAHQDADLDMMSPLPSERLKVLLRRVVGQTQFGVMDTRLAQAVGGVSLSPSGEMIFPAALALRGRLALVPDGMLSIRAHKERHGGDRASELRWVNPGGTRVAFPYSRSTPLLLREIAAAPLSRRDRRRCTAVVLWWWTRPGWRHIAGDVARLPYDLQLARRRTRQT